MGMRWLRNVVVSIIGLVVLLQDSYSVLDLLHVDSNYRCFRNTTHIFQLKIKLVTLQYCLCDHLHSR